MDIHTAPRQTREQLSLGLLLFLGLADGKYSLIKLRFSGNPRKKTEAFRII